MIAALETAIGNRLTGGTALTTLLAGTASVYQLLAPPDAALDFVVFDIDYDEPNDTPKRPVDCTLTIRGVSSTSLAKAGSIDAAVEGLIRDQELTVTGWGSYWQKRVRGFAYAETGPGHQIWHVGGEYLIRLQEA